MKHAQPTWTKEYDDPRRCATARAHHRWFMGLDSGVRIPALQGHGQHHLDFEHLGCQQPGPEHIGLLAAALGRIHAAAHARWLHAAAIDQPFQAADVLITDFYTPRRHVLQTVDLGTTPTAVAVYKDANIRNFLLTDDGAAIVDFDDLTLAPFGYDLAKLVVSTAMTHGPITEQDIVSALDSYNRQTRHLGVDATCTYEQFTAFAQIHHHLTARYLGRHGYRYAWTDVSPPREHPGSPGDPQRRHPPPARIP